MSFEFQLLIKNLNIQNTDLYLFNTLWWGIYPAKYVEMPTTVGILKFMSRIKSCSVELSMEKGFITSVPVLIHD